MNEKNGTPGSPRKALVCQGSRIWFTREKERRFYFFLTVLMLLCGILYKIGVL